MYAVWSQERREIGPIVCWVSTICLLKFLLLLYITFIFNYLFVVFPDCVYHLFLLTVAPATLKPLCRLITASVVIKSVIPLLVWTLASLQATSRPWWQGYTSGLLNCIASLIKIILRPYWWYTPQMAARLYSSVWGIFYCIVSISEYTCLQKYQNI